MVFEDEGAGLNFAIFITIFAYIIVVFKKQPFSNRLLFKMEVLNYLILVPNVYLAYTNKI